ncbi:MAG: glucosaminidase domain-containing protein, partial [Rhodospirillaceae bacterium]
AGNGGRHAMPNLAADRRRLAPAAAIALTLAAAAAIFWPRPAPPPPIETANRTPLSVTEIHADLDYSLHDVAQTKRVPRLFIENLKADLQRIPDVDEKKRTFFRIMLPIVAAENERIRAERARIDGADDGALADLYTKYGVDAGERQTLLRRVDIVPASLALAQAAIESGWGTSRFARQGNNFFGMRTYSDAKPGIAPREADGFKVSAYPNIARSVRAYMFNLNTHWAYADFRAARARQRSAHGGVRGLDLVGFLGSYSEIPKKYANRLRSLIDADDLHRYEGVRLDER